MIYRIHTPHHGTFDLDRPSLFDAIVQLEADLGCDLEDEDLDVEGLDYEMCCIGGCHERAMVTSPADGDRLCADCYDIELDNL